MAAIPDDALGAFCRHTHVAVTGSGKGPLAGLTFGVKDIYDIAGHKTADSAIPTGWPRIRRRRERHPLSTACSLPART